MAKYLTKECVQVRFDTVQISRKDVDKDTYRTYIVLMGSAMDEDGNVLEKIHEKIWMGSEGPDPWNTSSVLADIKDAGKLLETKCVEIFTKYTVA